MQNKYLLKNNFILVLSLNGVAEISQAHARNLWSWVSPARVGLRYATLYALRYATFAFLAKTTIPNYDTLYIATLLNYGIC